MFLSHLLPWVTSCSALSLLPNVVVRGLAQKDFLAWTELRDEVIADLQNPDMYVRETDEAAFFAQHSLLRGQNIGVFADGELVAYAMISMPSAGDVNNLGAVIGLPMSSRASVSHFESCMVRASWRGKQLQSQLLKLRCALALAYQRPLCLAMTSLHNHASRNNMFAHGMCIGWTGMIDGLQRHVLQLDLWGRQSWDLQDSRLICAQDFDQLCAASASGYVGVGEDFVGAQRMLRYARRLPDKEARERPAQTLPASVHCAVSV